MKKNSIVCKNEKNSELGTQGKSLFSNNGDLERERPTVYVFESIQWCIVGWGKKTFWDMLDKSKNQKIYICDR